MTDKPDPARLIPVLAELFPAAFVADKMAQHRPLKVGIYEDLVALEVLTPEECRLVLRAYTRRRQYQRALAAGGARHDLDGNIVGEVTAQQQEGPRKALAAWRAKREARRAAEGRAWMAERQAARKAVTDASGRLSLGDLKAAGTARRARTSNKEAAS